MTWAESTRADRCWTLGREKIERVELFRLQFLLVTFAAWVSREQANVIDYLREENRVLKDQLRTRQLRLTDSQGRRLAARGPRLGLRLLIITAGTGSRS